MDFTAFRLLNSLAGHGTLWDGVIVFFASYLQYVLGLLLIVMCAWPAQPASPMTTSRGGRIRIFTTALGAAVFARLALKPLILIFVQRARPYTTLTDASNILGPQLGEELQSMPSGHALFFFALAMVVYRYNKRWGTVFFAGALIMGITRIIGGIHWPSDVLVGALIGIMTGWSAVQWIPWFKKALPKTE